MTRFIRWAVQGCLSSFLLVFLVVTAFSQSRNTGEIRGTATAGGAAVPNASVTLTNVDTGETKTFTTNEVGIYDTVSTPTGTYNITFSAQGFKKLVRGPIVLQVNTITQDASLEVGAVTETVTVEAEGVPILDGDSASGRHHGSKDHR